MAPFRPTPSSPRVPRRAPFPPRIALLLALAAALVLAAPASAADGPSPAPATAPTPDEAALLDYLSRIHLHGMRAGDARAFSRDHLPLLRALLRDPEADEVRHNVVLLLGYLGDADTAADLVAFLDSGSGELEGHELAARLAVPYSLANLAHAGHDAPLAWLLDAASPERRAAHRPDWTFGALAGERLDEVVARLALMSLGASGRHEAAAYLEDLRATGRHRPDWHDNVEEALIQHRRIAAIGWDEVYGVDCLGEVVLDGADIPAPHFDLDDPGDDHDPTALERLPDPFGILTSHQFTVGRHVNVTGYSNSAVDAILRAASNVLQVSSNPDTDVACGIAMSRRGDVQAWGTTDDGFDIISTQAELTAVFSRPYQVKVVVDLQYCGGQFNAGIIGCAFVGSPKNLIVDRNLTATTSLGKLWAHEFGHNQGLSHVAGALRIMAPSLGGGGNSSQVIDSECRAFHSTVWNRGRDLGPFPLKSFATTH